MLGGMVGQWENAADGAEMVDCYFGGSAEAAEATTSTAGIEVNPNIWTKKY